MLVGELAADLPRYSARLDEARSSVVDPVAWYPYSILSNVVHLDRLLDEPYRDLSRLIQGLPVADIGAGDGDLAFTLEMAVGASIDIVDTARTNYNKLMGARQLAAQLGSAVTVNDINLDEQFRLPRSRYGLALLLGILYHLQNPYFVMRQLAAQAGYCLLSTRVARFAGEDRTEIANLPVAYLLGPTELNNDNTNYWIFSDTGLVRLVERAGWTVLARMNIGDTEASTPDSLDHDERVFMLLQSRLGG